MPASNTKQIICSDQLPKQARWANLSHWGLLAVIPLKEMKCKNGTSKFHNLWTMLAMKFQKVADDIQNNENKY